MFTKMSVILSVEFSSGTTYALEIYKNIYKVTTDDDIEFFATREGIEEFLNTAYESAYGNAVRGNSVTYILFISLWENEEEKCILLKDAENIENNRDNIKGFKKSLHEFLFIHRNISIDPEHINSE